MAKKTQDRSLVGLAGAGCQVIGTVLYAKSLDFIPFFNFFPKLIGSLFFMLSGIFWTIEVLTDDLTDSHHSSRWSYVKHRFNEAFTQLHLYGNNALTWNTIAGVVAMLASTLALMGLYIAVMASPLYWISNALIIVSCVGWYYGSSPLNGHQMTVSDQLNQIAAVAQVLAIVFMVAATYYTAKFMGYADLSLALLSGVAWFVSYCLPKDLTMGEVLQNSYRYEILNDELEPRTNTPVNTVAHQPTYMPSGTSFIAKKDNTIVPPMVTLVPEPVVEPIAKPVVEIELLKLN